MKLVFTHYVDNTTARIEGDLDRAVTSGLDAAAGLLSDDRHDTTTAAIDRGLRVDRGLTALDGTEVRVSGTDRLATLEISVPWSDPDAGTAKLWAAVRFASVVADEVRLAA